MIIADGYYFSPIGVGDKLHLFRKGVYDRALCLKGPSYTIWHDAHTKDICKVCLKKYEKEGCK
jgi:hypothetical protein